VWADDSQCIAELSAEVCRLRFELSERDSAIDSAINSRSIAWHREAKARARVDELSTALDNLQVYCNTLHEEVHLGMGAGPSGIAGERRDGELDFLSPLLL
jgi:hypothetical protein